MFELENLIALLTLTAMEIVLGIDNIVFIAILSARLPANQRDRGRRIGLAAAMIMRIGLLLFITRIMTLKDPWFALFGHDFSGKDLIILAGGLFLIAKATHEIHNRLEGPEQDAAGPRIAASLAAVIVQIMLMDIIFSLDSVITAVGMANQLWVMITAVVIAVGVMLIFARRISEFVERHPTVKMLALSFLLLIGVTLVADGFGRHIEKGYIYFAMAFSLFVELLNLRWRKVTRPVHLHAPALPDQDRRS